MRKPRAIGLKTSREPCHLAAPSSIFSGGLAINLIGLCMFGGHAHGAHGNDHGAHGHDHGGHGHDHGGHYHGKSQLSRSSIEAKTNGTRQDKRDVEEGKPLEEKVSGWYGDET